MFKANNKKIYFTTHFCLKRISNGFGCYDSSEMSMIFRTTTNVFEKSDILNIHKYLQVKNNIMFKLIKQALIKLLSFTKCMSLNNEPSMTTITHKIFETNSSFHVK